MRLRKFIRQASERIIKASFEYAQNNGHHKVTCIHKANILKKSDGLFLDIFSEIKNNYPEIETNDIIVDNACMQLVMNPSQFDVMVMPNLYGDILSDLTSGLISGLGLLPSMNLGYDYALFEAVHCSAPDIAGKDLANPTALLLSACLMLDHLGYSTKAHRIREVLYKVLEHKELCTKDIGGQNSLSGFTSSIISELTK